MLFETGQYRPDRSRRSPERSTIVVFLGVRTLRDAFRVRLGAETDDEIAATRVLMSAAAAASNPLTIACLLALRVD